MDTQAAFARALRQIRKARNMSQEDFGGISSRTYLSTLERGLKNPTLMKIEALAGALGVQPLTLLLATYIEKNPDIAPEQLIQTALEELKELDAKPKQDSISQ